MEDCLYSLYAHKGRFFANLFDPIMRIGFPGKDTFLFVFTPIDALYLLSIMFKFHVPLFCNLKMNRLLTAHKEKQIIQ